MLGVLPLLEGHVSRACAPVCLRAQSGSSFTFTPRTRGADVTMELTPHNTAAAASALAAIACCVRTLLGPQRTLKCGAESISTPAVVSGNALTVLDWLTVQHPAGLVLLEVAETLHTQYGSGVATLICLTGALAHAVKELCLHGFGVHTVLHGLRQAAELCCETLAELALPIRLAAPWSSISAGAGMAFHAMPSSPPPSPPSPPSPRSLLTEAEALAPLPEPIEAIDDDVAWFFEVGDDKPPTEESVRSPSAQPPLPAMRSPSPPRPPHPAPPQAMLSPSPPAPPSPARAPPPEPAPQERALALKERGNALLADGRLSDALGCYTRAVDAYGEARAVLRASGAGGEAAEEAAALSRALCVSLSNRALVLCKLGRPEEALADAQRALLLDRTYAKAHHRAAAALDMLGRSAEAQQAYARSRSANSRSSALEASSARAVQPAAPSASHTDTAVGRAAHTATASSSYCNAAAGVHSASSSSSAALRLSHLVQPPTVPPDLAALGAALAHGCHEEMAIALECAAIFGRPPWHLKHALRVQHLVGRASTRASSIPPNRLQPLMHPSRAFDLQLATPPDAAPAGTNSDNPRAWQGVRCAGACYTLSRVMTSRASPSTSLMRSTPLASRWSTAISTRRSSVRKPSMEPSMEPWGCDKGRRHAKR